MSGGGALVDHQLRDHLTRFMADRVGRAFEAAVHAQHFGDLVHGDGGGVPKVIGALAPAWLVKRDRCMVDCTDMIGPASLDVRMGRTALLPARRLNPLHYAGVQARNDLLAEPWSLERGQVAEDFDEVDLLDRPLILKPGEVALVDTAERFFLPSYINAQVAARSSVGRWWLRVCACAGYIDPGFSDASITLELHNAGPRDIKIHAGDRIAQVVFFRCAGAAERPYGHEERDSHYQGQRGPTISSAQGGGDGA